MIPRRLRPAVAAGAAALAWLLTGTLAAQGPSLEALFDEYAAGHYVALPRTLRTRQDVVAAMRDSANLLDQWRRDWVPVHAAFLLEFSIVGESRGWPGFAATIGSARDLVTHRPQSIGQNAAEDRFELTFHRVAMAFLCGTDTFAAEQYLTAIERRVLPAPPAGGAPALVDARMALARGVARDLRTSPAVQSGRGGLSAPAGSGRDAAAERRN